MDEYDDRQRFEDLLPFYVNGTLVPDDRAWVDACLERTPDARAALAWHEALAQTLEERHARIPADVNTVSPGLPNFLASRRTRREIRSLRRVRSMVARDLLVRWHSSRSVAPFGSSSRARRTMTIVGTSSTRFPPAIPPRSDRR